MPTYALQSGLTKTIIVSTNLAILVKLADMCQGLVLEVKGPKPTDFNIVYSYGESKITPHLN